MGELTVIRPGMLTQLQDQGRPGLAYFAIPRSGPLDRYSAELGNALLGNKPSAAVIECHFVSPILRFETSAAVCLTGASMNWTLNGQTVHTNRTLRIPADGILEGGQAVDGCRAYLSIQGSIQTQRTFGSAACCQMAGFGGNSGRPLATGDQIHWQEATDSPADFELISAPIFQPNNSPLKLVPGPEFDWLTASSQRSLQNEKFQVTADGNRMGVRLAGPVLSTKDQTLSNSVPVLPGMLQLPNSGQPIVVLPDGQTTGGYPRIAILPEAQRIRLCQMPPRTWIQFELL